MTTILNKRILLSLGMIIFVAVGAIGATGAFFSDTETSTGNTFTAGAIDLQIDSECTYNGVSSNECGSWALKDLVPTSDSFFNFADIKPGDKGENTISLHVINNDAWVCANVSNLTDYENGQTEPEALVDETVGTNEGELSNTMNWTVWKDTDGDNVLDSGEIVLASGHPENGTLPVYDSTTGAGALPGGSTAYLGVKWELPASSGNETQTDRMTGDISFYVEQARNNDGFVCGQGLKGALSAEDFGVVNYDPGSNLGILHGYTAGFGLTDATFAGVQSVVVKLYAGNQLLQTNTLNVGSPAVTALTGIQISSPFDVLGAFSYVTDGYWTNVRESEYGEGIAATKVVATVVLSNGKIVTAENTNLTGGSLQ